MNTAICAAIGARAVLQFYYDGGLRTVEPHCHGISSARNEVVRAYQTAGYSRSGKPVGWKLFVVADISKLQSLSLTFRKDRPGYNKNDQGMTRVHCSV